VATLAALAALSAMALAGPGASAAAGDVVAITSNSQIDAFRQALQTPGTTVDVADGVRLDLTNQQTFSIAAGVTLRGGRTATAPGPLLYTRKPSSLFKIDGNQVRITGVRIGGPDLGVPGGGYPAGISVNSHTGIEIDHNEVYGFKGEAIDIRDKENVLGLRDHRIRVHDNWIHHNQHTGSHGYGVVVSDGGTADIERNVFDWNRHAIAGDGSNGSSYRAFDNLVLQHGGYHRWVGFWVHTHQFDMHGQRNCGVGSIFSDSLFNCGRAGYSMDISYNTFLYDDGPAIKLRGTPQRRPCGALVVSNVFAHGGLGDAVEQTERGLCKSRNLTGVNSLRRVRTCDMDGEGLLDSFLATGQTWWYASGKTKPWVFLRRSPARPTTCPAPVTTT
jgi:hypothetical protein